MPPSSKPPESPSSAIDRFLANPQDIANHLRLALPDLTSAERQQIEAAFSLIVTTGDTAKDRLHEKTREDAETKRLRLKTELEIQLSGCSSYDGLVRIIKDFCRQNSIHYYPPRGYHGTMYRGLLGAHVEKGIKVQIEDREYSLVISADNLYLTLYEGVRESVQSTNVNMWAPIDIG